MRPKLKTYVPQSGMLAAARVVVLVQRRAVEASERPRVGREMRGDPVEDHADPVRVQVVDEVPEIVGRAHRRDGRVEVRHLVAPRAGVRVVHDRQQLDVREPEVGHVRGELGRRARASRGRAATTARAPRRSTPAARAAAAHAALRASRRPATRTPSGRRPRPTSAAAPARTRAGRPSRGRRGGTCSAARSSRPRRCLPRCPLRRPAPTDRRPSPSR